MWSFIIVMLEDEFLLKHFITWELWYFQTLAPTNIVA